MGADVRFTSWTSEIVPDVVWIGVLHRSLGDRDGVASAVAIATAAQSCFGHYADIPSFAFARSFAALSDAQLASTQTAIAESPHGRRGLRALARLFRCYPAYPLARLDPPTAAGTPAVTDLTLLREVTGRMLDRSSPDSVRVHATAVHIALATRKLLLTDGIAPLDLNQALDYPNTAESLVVASRLRAFVQGLAGTAVDTNASELESWPVSFWRRGLELAECR